jgi:filamentous hemagglutinin family protein
MRQTVVGLMWVGISTLSLAYAETVVGLDRVQAQVIPDSTLPTAVTTPNNLDFTINGGTRSGNNLFHSFSQLSIPTGGSALFNNATDIQTIFARVTGGSASNIDGLLKANGTANLFLLNPSGILFGANAQLNIGGSFVGTTANSIQFADGTEFSAVNPSSPPLLTMSAPIGLQMGANAAPIQIQGPAAPNSFMRPPTISLAPAQTLALVGGQIDINSANLSASDGRIELWAVGNGRVAIDNQTGWKLTSPATTATWGTITLQQASLVDASGANGGAINVRGRGLTLKDLSNISSRTFAGQGQGITVNTTEFIELLGNSDPQQTFVDSYDGIVTSVGNSLGVLSLPGPPATGRAGDVTIETGRLFLQNGAWLQSVTGGDNSRAGDVTIRANEIEAHGNPLNFSVASILSMIVGGNNNQAGQVTVDAQRIRLLEGSRISSSVVAGNGQAGEVSIRAAESLEIRGVNPMGGIGSAVLASVEAGATGQGGRIKIDTGNLIVSDGGSITSEIAGSKLFGFGIPVLIPGAQGVAGSIDILAKTVQVSDPMIDGFSNTITGITASVGNGAVGSGGNINLTADSLRVFNGGQITSSSQGQGAAGNINLNVNNIDVQGRSPSLLNGKSLLSTISATSTTTFAAGSVNIATESLSVRDRANITVSNTGTGDAGNLNIAAGTIFLNNGASLQAEVNGGNQGNIQLQARDLLLLRQGSQIVTSATGTSTGGNITINAPVIVGLENSDIVANAVQGRGGNIQITTQGIIGLQYRDRRTPENDITASSEFGVNGTVDVNNVGVDPNSGLVELSITLIDSNQQVAAACSGNEGSSFVITGRGGIPQNPTQEVSHNRSWNDMRDLSTFHKATIAQTPTPTPTIVQATTWQRNPQTGKVELLATQPAHPIPSTTCARASYPTGSNL